jgi:hypothetical protein
MTESKPKTSDEGAQVAIEETAPTVGRVVAVQGGEVIVEVNGVGQRLLARVSASLDFACLERAARERQEAVLIFERSDPARPIILALLRSTAPLVEAILDGPTAQTEKVVHVDAQRVVIDGKDEVVLRCGRASLTLRRDGKVILRGVNIVTHAERVQKIRGGKVQIN